MKAVIVEDHALFREFVAKLCREELHISIVGETGSGRTAVDIIREKQPDLLVLDLEIAGIDGFTVATQAKKFISTLKILVVSCHVEEHTVWRVEKLGVSGFVDKNDSSIAVIREALTAVISGGTYFSAPFYRRQLERVRDRHSAERILSAREQEILVLISGGASDHGIATRLQISPTTAQTHRRNICHKLGVAGTRELMAFAFQHGFSATAVSPEVFLEEIRDPKAYFCTPRK